MNLQRDENIIAAVGESACRTVKLGGHDFTVAPLTLRQILGISDFVPKLSEINAATLSGERLAPLAEVTFIGIRRAHPQISRDEFFDLPITIAELVTALPIVIEQAGAKRAGEPGEALATSASTLSIGASSSPPSAQI